MARAICLLASLFLVLSAQSALGVGGKMHLEDISLGIISNNDVIPNPATAYDQTGPSKTWSTSGDADDRPTEEVAFYYNALNGQPPHLVAGGNWAVDSFFDIFYSIDLRRGSDPFVHYTGTGTAHVAGTAPGGSSIRVFDLEMLELNISGVMNGITPFMIRESPTLQSTGKTAIESLPGGQFRIDSFFDVFTEMSIDGGQTWAPALPEPSAITLAAFAAGGLARHRRRWWAAR